MREIELSTYKKATHDVPIINAAGIVKVGFSTEPAGVVAASTPRKAHKVNDAALPISMRFDVPVNDGDIWMFWPEK